MTLDWDAVYCVAMYVYTPATIRLHIPTRLSIWPLELDRGRYFTGKEEVVPADWTIGESGVYGWVADFDVRFDIVSGDVQVRAKRGGKDPWPPPPPPPPKFAQSPGAGRFPVHAYAHHEECNGHPSELFLGALDASVINKR